MFAAYRPLDKCIGKEIQVRLGDANLTGMLAGVYVLGSMPILVITPMHGSGAEQHIPLQGVVVTVKD